MDEKGFLGRTELAESHGGLYRALRERGLLKSTAIGRIRRSWVGMPDDEILDFARKKIDEEGISSRRELAKKDAGLATVLQERKLSKFITFKMERGAPGYWSSKSDDEIVEYAKKVMAENGIISRADMRKIDGGLDAVLDRRGLIDKCGLKIAKTRNWASMSDRELVAFAIRFIEENEIRKRGSLKDLDSGLHHVLGKRGLMGKVFSKVELQGENEGLLELFEALDEFGGEECD
jgi:hypothetical protein